MKKRRITFSVFNYFGDSGPEVLKLQGAFDAFSAIIMGATVITSSDRNALIAGAVCYLVNQLIKCIKVENIEYERENN
jgi:hypothetical protein